MSEEEQHEPEVDQAEPEWTPEDEETARLYGWKSPDEWRGEVPSTYIGNPKDYVDRWQNVGPVKALRERIERQEREHERIQEALAKTASAQMEAQRRDHQARIDQLTANQRKAVEEGDVERYDELERERRKMRPPAETRPEPVDLVKEFGEGRPWLRSVSLQHQIGQIVDAGLRSGAIRTDDAREQFAFAESELRITHPHLFEEKPKPKPSPVDGGGLAMKRKEGFESLPAKAKEAFKALVARKIFEDTEAGRKRYYDNYPR